MRFFALGLLAALFLAVPVYGKEGTGAIEGQVVAAESGVALRDAVVTISGPFAVKYLGLRDRPTAGPLMRVETDREGRFVFSKLASGNYEIVAMKDGFAASNWRYETRATELTAVAEGRQVKGVVLKLEAAAIIAGTVRDPGGTLLQGATVRVLRRTYRDSRRSHFILCPGSGRTDDRGRYRISGVPSGSYLLRVTGPRSEKSFPLLYFPDTTDYRAAQWIALRPGEERKIDFTMRTGPLARLRGLVLPPDGVTTNALTVGLNPRGDGPSSGVEASATMMGNQSHFDIGGVSPGSYILSVADQEQKLAALQELDVRGDVDGLFVKLAPAHKGHGVVYVEGSGTPALKGIMVSLLPLDLAGCGAPSATVREDATFSFDLLAPLHYTIAVANLPEGYYVRSIRLGGKAIGGAGFAIESDASFTIALARGTAHLAGAVADAAGRPAAYSEVTLIPADAAAPGAWNALADAQGNFSFDGLAPGRYQVLGWETPEDAPYLRAQDSDVLAPFAAQARMVTLAAGERQTVSLTVITAGESRKLVAPR